MMKRMKSTCLAALLVTSGLAIAAPNVTLAQADAPAAQQNQRPETYRLKKEILGKKVIDSQGREAGTIEDLAIESMDGRVAYVVVEPQGRKRLVAVPFELLRIQGETLSFNVPQNKLDEVRGFRKDEWPDMHQRAWGVDAHREFGVRPYWESRRKLNAAELKELDANDGTGPMFHRTENAKWASRATDILSSSLTSESGERLGKISDLMVDVRQGRGHVVYAIVTDTPGIKDTMAMVPFAAIKPVKGKQFTVDATVDDLRVASLNESQLDQMANPGWGRRVHKAFKRDPYWAVFGTLDDAAADDQDPAWQPGGEYLRRFDMRNIRRFDGKVTSKSSFEVPGGGKGSLIVLTSDEDNRQYTIHLGPASYFDSADSRIKLQEGDRIMVRAARGSYEGKEIYLASHIGQMHELRDAQGKAQWRKIDNEGPKNDRRENRGNDKENRGIEGDGRRND